jgi:hypothetical protein
MWFSAMTRQDDIFEGRPLMRWRDPVATVDEVREIARRQGTGLRQDQIEEIVGRFLDRLRDPAGLASLKRELENRYQELYRTSSIACFFRDPFGVRKWTDYAGRGTGFALVFDMTIPWVFEGAIDMEPTQWAPFPVNYVPRDRRPIIELKIAPAEPRASFEDLERALLTKSDEWRDQQEERFVRVGIPASHVFFPPESLVGVILGHAMDEETQARFAALARVRKTPIEVYRSALSEQHFTLDFQRVF